MQFINTKWRQVVSNIEESRIHFKETTQTMDSSDQSKAETKTSEKEENEYTVHVVQEGVSLSVIGQQYGVSMQAIINLNKITDANLIVIEQELLIPKPKEN